MIDVSELMSDPDFAQPFQVVRSTGSFANEGEYTRTPTTLNMTGVIQPATTEDVTNFLPEGERQKSAIRIWCAQEIRMADGNGAEADEIVWQGKRHRVAHAKPWNTQGYWFAIAVGHPYG